MNTQLKQVIKKIIGPVYFRFKKIPEHFSPDPRWLEIQERLKGSKRVIDLGCGNNPAENASVAVDLYVEPEERILGAGATIDIKKIEARGVKFVNARIDTPLPFKDKEFDFAYSHHAFEHVENPKIACDEIMRIAKAGVIITPTLFSDLIFGRPYHRWLMMQRDNTLFFFKKRPFEDRPFGVHPLWDERNKKWVAESNTNPFEILLNDENWYKGPERMPRLAGILRKHWYSHSPLIETIFLWDNCFEYKIYE